MCACTQTLSSLHESQPLSPPYLVALEAFAEELGSRHTSHARDGAGKAVAL